MNKLFLILFVFTISLFAHNIKEENKTVNIAFGFDKQPFIFGKDMLKGIEPDLLKEAFEYVGYKINAVRMTKNDLEKALIENPTIDAVSTISANNHEFYYSDDFTVYENYAITRKIDNIKIDSIDDLQKINFISWKNSFNDLGKRFYELFNPIDGISKNFYHDGKIQSEDVKKFFSKEVDAILIDKTIFNWYKNLYKNNNEYEFHKIFPNKKVYPVTFKSKELRDIFNIGLRHIKQTGRYQEIIDFYQTQKVIKLKTYVDVLADISSKYLYLNEYDELKNIIKYYFNDDSIVSIQINNLNKDIVNITKKDLSNSSYFKKNIFYKNTDNLMMVGTIKVYYVNDIGKDRYKLDKLIPSLEKLEKLNQNDLEIISNMYSKYNLLKFYKKTIKTCVGPNWLPFEKITQDGDYIGIIAQYNKLIAKKTDLKFEYKYMDSIQQSYEYLKNNKCDIIMADIATSEIKKEFLATKPYYIAQRAFVTHKDTPWVSDLSFLLKHNKKVGVVKDSPASKILKKLYKDKIDLIPFVDTKSGLKAVSSKEIIAFVNIMPTLAYTIQENLFTDIKIAGYLEQDIPLSIILNKKNIQILPILNKAIDDISQEEKANIFNKWIRVSFEEKVNYFYLQIAVLIIILIILIAIYINRLLKKRIQIEVQKNQEQQKLILQQSRLAQMGEMISMIAHQWRQPLNSLSVLNQSIVLKYKRNKLTDELIDYFNENSKKQIQNMSKTIDDFRDFFKPEKEKTIFCVNDVISSTLEMVEPIFIKDNINIIFDNNKKYNSIGFPNEVGQVFLNIVNNAKDALIENNIDIKNIQIEILKDKENVIITIQDNAGGIPDDIIDKIFDPYFSTKLEKDGTGLGLYMSKMIIEDHCNGKITVTNTKEGAMFKVALKASNE